MDHHLLNKYLDGKCTDAEKATVELWLEDNSPLPIKPVNDEDHLIQQEAFAVVSKRIKKPFIYTTPIFKYLSAAAIVILIASVSIIVNRGSNSDIQVQPIAQWKTTEIPDGQKATVKLPDGSVIELNGGSSFAYPDRFSNERVVKLIKGDAFFVVSKDPHRPFIVETDDHSRIRVLGTRFNVKNNSFTSNLEITLNSGKISFERRGHEPQLLAPGQQLNYALNTYEITAPFAVDTLMSSAWRKNILIFRDTPIQQVFREIEQAHGVKFVVQKSIKEQLMTAEFTSESLDRILTILGKTSKLKFKQQENRIYVNP